MVCTARVEHASWQHIPSVRRETMRVVDRWTPIGVIVLLGAYGHR